MPENHSQRAYSHIRNKLLEGTIAPGTRLSYGPVGKEIGVSATPVREAVGQLASEGFFELVPQLGAIVRRLSRQEVNELYELREALESFAAERVAARFSARQRAVLEENLTRSAQLAERVRRTRDRVASRAIAKKFHALDLAFHMAIVAASGNRRMLKVVGDSHILTRIFNAERHGFETEVLEATQAEHHAIFNAICEGDSPAARDAMRKHIRNSLPLTLNGSEQPAANRWRETSRAGK